MAAQDIRLDYVNLSEAGPVEVGFTWNGSASSTVFSSPEHLVDQNSTLLQEQAEAVRWLLYYLLALGATPDTLGNYVGRRLVVDIGPAVQQNISLV